MGTHTQFSFRAEQLAGLLTDDTPTKSKHAATMPAIAGGLEEGRNAMMKDLHGAIPQGPLDWFKAHVLPPLPQLRSKLKGTADTPKPSKTIVQAVVEALKRDATITENGRWSAFPQLPSSVKQLEDIVYKPFEDIAVAVSNAAKLTVPNKQRVAFECNPNMTSLSNLRRNTSRPDGYGLYTSHGAYKPEGSAQWECIVVPGEVKKENRYNHVNDVSGPSTGYRHGRQF